ncbi:MAG: GspE/PulE family protein [Phycisphaeraceae bacterium]
MTDLDLRVGQTLLERGRLTQAQLDRAIEQGQRHGRQLGEVFCDMGCVDPEQLRRIQAEHAGFRVAEFPDQRIDPEAMRQIPAETALERKLLAFAQRDGDLDVAMADPFDHDAAELVRVLTGRRVVRCYCPESELVEVIRKAYGSSAARMIADLDAPDGQAGDTPGEENLLELQELAREPSVVNLVNLIVLEAIEAQASDVHIEPFEKVVRVKYRIDGVLQEMAPPPRHLYAAIISRLKIMAGMNIAERFVPQDGHIGFQTPRGKVDIRVGTVPTVYGESMALRLLDRSVGLLELERLGLAGPQKRGFAQVLEKPHGIVLVTGPTGSGKSTTLYAALNHIYSPEKKIITIEDPVEYQLDGINQIPVNRKRGVDFAGGLRAILRQDPDVIMVGEIRDRETADIAIRSALTGHLVFSTLHTNSAAGAVSRLIDMGVEPYLLSSSLEGVLAQRLVRRICPECKREDRPEPEVLARLGGDPATWSRETFYRGEGCQACRQTGYAGRMGVFELLRMTPALRRAVLHGADVSELLAAAPEDHEAMREDGLRRATAGQTTLEEVFRVTQDAAAEEAISGG